MQNSIILYIQQPQLYHYIIKFVMAIYTERIIQGVSLQNVFYDNLHQELILCNQQAKKALCCNLILQY